jgi:hypothetical protein
MPTYGSLTVLTPADLDDEPLAMPERGDAPIEYCDNPVPLRSEPLTRILWRGRQWAVTEYGIECLDGTYAIAAKRLTENIDQWPWTMQVTHKGWVDSDDFVTAWLVALSLHGKRPSKAKVRSAVERSHPSRSAVHGGRHAGRARIVPL